MEKQAEIKAKRDVNVPYIQVINGEPPNTILVTYVEKGAMKARLLPKDAQEKLDPKKKTIKKSVLQKGEVYGVAWEDFPFELDVKVLSNNLRLRGIWTLKDANQNPARILSAIQETLSLSIADLLAFAREQEA